MTTATIDGITIDLAEGEKLNCIQAAAKAGKEVPHYCWHQSLSVVASCRMCLVEVGDRKDDGSVVMQPKLVPGCQTPVKAGSVVITNSEKVRTAQKATLEYLLLNHPLDCPTCDQAGECGLQDYSFNYGRGYSRLQEPKNQKLDKDYIGEHITLFTDRCIMCTRCVRFTREVSGTSELQVIGRGSHEEIDIFPGLPCNNKLAGNVVDLCPVGALCSKDFLYQQRVWFLNTTNSVCPNCSTGCSIRVDHNKGKIYRVRPRANPQNQGDFICDDGRFGWDLITNDKRLTKPLVRQRPFNGSGNAWDNVLAVSREAIGQVLRTDATRFALIVSPWATIEETYLASSYLESIHPGARMCVGPIRLDGVDDHYPKQFDGTSATNAKFTIRAEKCPNVRGAEIVLRSISSSITSIDEIIQLADQNLVDGILIVGNDPYYEWSHARVNSLRKAKHLIVLGNCLNKLTDVADVVLCGVNVTEREGTFINAQGLAQRFERSVRGPGESRQDSRILWELAGRSRLYNTDTVLKEVANRIPQLSALAGLQADSLGSLIEPPRSRLSSK